MNNEHHWTQSCLTFLLSVPMNLAFRSPWLVMAIFKQLSVMALFGHTLHLTACLLSINMIGVPNKGNIASQCEKLATYHATWKVFKFQDLTTEKIVYCDNTLSEQSQCMFLRVESLHLFASSERIIFNIQIKYVPELLTKPTSRKLYFLKIKFFAGIYTDNK